MSPSSTRRRRASSWRTTIAVRLAALLVPFVLAWALWLVRAHLDQAAAVLVLVLPVVAAAACGDRWAGVLAAVSSAVWFDVFFTAPYLSVAIWGRDDLELVGAFLLVGAAVTELALWGRRQSAVALRRATYLDDAISLSSARTDPTDLRWEDRTACGEIARVLGAEDVTYEHGAPPPSQPTIDADGRIRKNTHVLRSLPTDEVTVIPVRWGNDVVGHVRVTAGHRTVSPDPEQGKVAVLLAGQIAHQAMRR
ncbi:DUF4118 domain-containing protein [Mobilicoccus pelagius]|uniref:Sensor protein KdpD transmembrane domain-containing protein n=1 Tax=Mobilicoccus pelagius NBRC 104925 TaxID=1089455 RepID=H5UP08_9MICO|nr:DUF4118 domain-containing protein [Mobilicoccus pelagius]GAB47466.1 hypothetical protein MOPEL_013_00080 [Mobilicoccus pelagius NBRC 104925]